MSWVRVRRDLPCPICHHRDWCLRAADGSAAICQRVEQGARRRIGETGWLHVLDPRATGARGRIHAIRVDDESIRHDFTTLSEQYSQAMTSNRYAALAGRLGVSVESLHRLQVGYAGPGRYSFPMSDLRGRTIGVRIRTDSGRKFCVRGSKTGLFIPTDLTGRDFLLVAEGNTDTAAGLDLGFDCVGRPSADTGANMLGRFCKGRDVIIAADNDPKPDGTCPGIRGAIRLAVGLRLYCRCVKVVFPPDGIKDLRAWLQDGLTHEELLNEVERVEPVGLEVR